MIDSSVMFGYRFPLLALTLVLVAISCHSSTETTTQITSAQSRNSSRPRPIAKIIDVEPPVSFGKSTVPGDKPSEFTVHGVDGQFLRLSVDQEAEYDSLFSISVQGPDSSEVKPLDCTGSPVFPFQQTGSYRIHFEPSGSEHTLAIVVLPNNDPLVDPGLKAEQISMHLGSFAQRDQIQFSPYCAKDFLPAAVALTNDRIWLRIMQVAGYETFFSPYSRLSELQDSLRGGTTNVDANKMPRLSTDGATIVMTARQKLVTGDGWRGWRWVQDEDGGDYLGRHLRYVFEGITNDGRLFFVLRAPISNLEFDRLSSEIRNPNKINKKERTENQLLMERTLATAAATSFQPGINQLDAIVQSTRFIH